MKSRFISILAIAAALSTLTFTPQSNGALLVMVGLDKLGVDTFPGSCDGGNCILVPALVCLIGFPLLPLCLLDAQGGTPAISDEFLNENGYTPEQVATIRGDLDVLSARLKERGATLKLENNDTIDSLTTALRDLDPEVAPITAEVIWQVMH